MAGINPCIRGSPEVRGGSSDGKLKKEQIKDLRQRNSCSIALYLCLLSSRVTLENVKEMDVCLYLFIDLCLYVKVCNVSSLPRL